MTDRLHSLIHYEQPLNPQRVSVDEIDAHVIDADVLDADGFDTKELLRDGVRRLPEFAHQEKANTDDKKVNCKTADATGDRRLTEP